METKVTSPVVKGVLIALILIILGFIGRYAKLQTESWFAWLSYCLLIAGIITSCIIYSNQSNHNVTFGNVFGHGFKTAAVVTCITIVFMVILLLVMPGMKQEMLDTAVRQAEKSGATEEQIEQQQSIFNRMFWVFIIGGILVMYLVMGLIGALIGGAVAKKNPQPSTPF